MGTTALDHPAALQWSVRKTRRPRTTVPKVSVIIPAKNEAANLPHVIPALPDIVSEVVLVDGRSTDDTIAVARSAPARRDRRAAVVPRQGRRRWRAGSRWPAATSS